MFGRGRKNKRPVEPTPADLALESVKQQNEWLDEFKVKADASIAETQAHYDENHVAKLIFAAWAHRQGEEKE